jgi:hypothetical protein
MQHIQMGVELKSNILNPHREPCAKHHKGDAPNYSKFETMGGCTLFNMSMYQEYKSLMHRNDRNNKITNKFISIMGHLGQALHCFYHGPSWTSFTLFLSWATHKSIPR